MSTTLGDAGGLPVLRIERKLAHPREKVWRAVTEPAQLSQWFPFHVAEMDLQVGGKIRFETGDGTATDAVVTELDPPRVFAFTQQPLAQMPREGENTIHIELLPREGGCLLVFTQTFHDRPAAASYASGWHTCLDVMETILDGGPARLPEGNFPELHQSYIEDLGLREGAAERGPDGWRVRFERQLTRPAEDVWRAAGGASARVGEPAPEGFCDGRAHGPVVKAEEPALLEFAYGGGRVRWELSPGTGHGARLVVTETGLADPDPALVSWRERIEALAKGLLP
ncbi:SRPBCC family protein [Microbispora sp. NPDC049125]|uniref:SRPBCC family protein n=1 Tax=Microbispora sp. NPDC049125 TaxID=3154929 RepID=UPI003466814C